MWHSCLLKLASPVTGVSFEMRNSALHIGRRHRLLCGNDIGSMVCSLVLKGTFCITHFSNTQQQQQRISWISHHIWYIRHKRVHIFKLECVKCVKKIFINWNVLRHWKLQKYVNSQMCSEINIHVLLFFLGGGHICKTLKSDYWLRHACPPPVRLSACVCVSVRPHRTTRLPLDGLSKNLIFQYFSKLRRQNSSFIKTWQ